MIDKERLTLAYQVGALQGFIKFGLPYLSMVKVDDQAAFEAAVEVAFKRIEEEAAKSVN